MIAVLSILTASAFQGYYQHPTVHGDQVVFEAEGDLWVVPLNGGVANRLTSHVEIETQPSLSPDGTSIAFLAHYDGSTQVYVMPVSGGVPKRLSFDVSPETLEGWTPDGDVLFSSRTVAGPPGSVLLQSVDPVTLEAAPWPLMNAHQGAVGPDGVHIVTRFGSQQIGDHVRYYRGGNMARLWTYMPGASEAKPLLAGLGANAKDPMWVDDRLYFLADVDGVFNLHSADRDGSPSIRHTQFKDRDVRRPATDGDTIVFQRGADLVRFDPASGESTVIPIEIRSDFDDSRERWLKRPTSFMTSMQMDANGERVAVTARGQISVAGVEPTRRVDIPLPDHVRARQAQLSADGKWVYAIVGEDDTEEMVRFDARGRGQSEALTSKSKGRIWKFVLSPDGKWFMHSDSLGDLWLTNTTSKKTRRVARHPGGGDVFAHVVFSNDGKRLAYTSSAGPRARVVVYDIDTKRTETVTSPAFVSRSPGFSVDGKWLYFLSDRQFDATPSGPWGDRNMGPQFDGRTAVYALDLTGEGGFPFLEEGLGVLDDPDKEDNEEEEEEEDDEETSVTVAWDGLSDRLYSVPVGAANYLGLLVGEDYLYLFHAPFGDDDIALESLEIDPDAEEDEIHSDVNAASISADGETLFFGSGKRGYIVPAGSSAPGSLGDHQVDLGGWRLPITPTSEWTAIFEDAWRMHRDFAFDPDLRSLNWKAVKKRYEVLIPRVTHRVELEDLLGEMTAELGILHSQTGAGELPDDPEGVSDGSLAARFEPVKDGLKVVERFDGDPDLTQERSPLSLPYVDVRVGDVLQDVNGRPVRTLVELSDALRSRANQRVVLTVKRGKDVRQLGVEPMRMWEANYLRYRNWEQGRRRLVTEKTNGSVGYLHLRSMGGSDIEDFAREYFAVSDLDGLIIDVRGNRGGNIDSWLLAELSRKPWSFWQGPRETDGHDDTNMQRAFRGHLVVLIDGETYSDGETFAAGIKALDLAPLIGTRTAGAGIWLSDRNRQVDGGRARIAEFGQYDLEGNWIIEGLGVGPDIVVENPPHASFKGADAQLERAILEVMEHIEREPIPTLRRKAIPPVGTPAQDVQRGSAG